MKLPVRVFSVAVPLLLVLAPSPASWAELRTNPAPRITAARMVDRDHDDKVDRGGAHLVRARSRHARDADHRYPFRSAAT